MIPRFPRWPSLRSRTGAIAALLIVTLAGTLAIGWEAHRAAAAERRTIEGVLRDYAGFAANEYVRVASRQLHAGAETALAHVTCAASRAVLSRALGDVPAKDCECGPAITPLRTVIAPSPSGEWQITGELIDDAIRAAMSADLRDPASEPVQLRVLSLRGKPAVVAWRTHRQPKQLVAALVADAEALRPILNRAATSPLLPSTLVPAVEAAGLLSLKVEAAGGPAVFTSAAAASEFSRAATFSAAAGGLTITASLAPHAAQRLVIGGLPRSRMPLVYGMTAVCVVLIVLAAIQLTREARLARQRTDFVAGVSHELRTPLTQIRMFAETLSLGRVRSADEQKESLDVIVRESQRLSHLVDKVLSFSRMERGPVLERRDLDFSALVRETVEGFAPLAAASDARIELNVDTGLRLNADPLAMRQAILNLLDNALKYGPTGQTVRVAVTSVPEGLVLTVEDEGPGVREEDRHRIWQPYWRAAGSEQGGSGIGLAIVERTVKLHGGRAWADDARAGGARFTIVFPAACTAVADPALEPANRPA